jgi:hypothetical protein
MTEALSYFNRKKYQAKVCQAKICYNKKYQGVGFGEN